MRKIIPAGLLTAALCMGISGMTMAAFEPEVEKGYNTAVQGQDALDGLDVKVEEVSVSSRTNIASEKQVELKVTGIKSSVLSADIAITADETNAQSYYRNGYYYKDTTEGKEKIKMDREGIWDRINSSIYLDMTSNYLKMLYSTSDEAGNVVYHFSATQDTLGDYTAKLLDQFAAADNYTIDSLQGTMTVDKDGHVRDRSISMVYTILSDQPGNENGEKASETFMMKADASFSENGEVSVSLPDLSQYKEAETKPVVTLTEKSATIYATADLNVRAAGSLEAAVIGGYPLASGITQTGYTSDGWVQVQYDGKVGYVWGAYTSSQRPVVTTAGSGIMYATTDVNVRSTHSTDGEVLGVLKKNSSVKITGTTSNGWTRVSFNGQTGYVSSNYLTWSEPVINVYVKDKKAAGTVTDASYGSLTVQTSSGTLIFNTVYSVMNIKDTLETGDYVTVEYEGSGVPYTATSVTDETSHSAASSSQYESLWEISGTVASYSSGIMAVSCADGTYRTFDLSDAEISSKPSAGDYVTVSWWSFNGKETKNVEAAIVE